MTSITNRFSGLFRRHKDVWKADLIIIAIFLMLVMGYFVWSPDLPTQEEMQEWTLRFGTVGPIAIILVVTLETVIAPLPGILVPIAVGALYGIWPGVLYVWIGDIIGSTIAFYISRKLGRPIVEKIISKKKLEHYDGFLMRNRLLVWLMYLIPILPLDIISFVVGMSKMAYKRFLFIISFGFAFNVLLLAFFGERLLTATGGERLLYAIAILVFIIASVSIEKSVAREQGGA